VYWYPVTGPAPEKKYGNDSGCDAFNDANDNDYDSNDYNKDDKGSDFVTATVMCVYRSDRLNES
jgi:hypothetical protein